MTAAKQVHALSRGTASVMAGTHATLPQGQPAGTLQAGLVFSGPHGDTYWNYFP